MINIITHRGSSPGGGGVFLELQGNNQRVVLVVSFESPGPLIIRTDDSFGFETAVLRFEDVDCEPMLYRDYAILLQGNLFLFTDLVASNFVVHEIIDTSFRNP